MILANVSPYRITLTLLLFAATTSAALAEHATIDLQVIGPEGRQRASSDQEPPLGGVNPRPRLTVKAGDPLQLQFMLTNVYPHVVLKHVTVRYFIVRTGKFGRKNVPQLTTGVVTQGAATLDFMPKRRIGARLKFRIDDPDIYLVRVETRNTQADHEHFSAIDLEVK